MVAAAYSLNLRFLFSINEKTLELKDCLIFAELVLRPGFGPGSETREAAILGRTILPERGFSVHRFHLY